MNMKRMMLTAAVGLSMLRCLTAQADTWTDDKGIVWTYAIVGGTACLGDLWESASAVPQSTIEEITIPSELGGCPVVGIEYDAATVKGGGAPVRVE